MSKKEKKQASSNHMEKLPLKHFIFISHQMAMVSSLEEQLQIRTSKLATLEKVLGNTRRHLQDAVENVRETELTYQSKIEELEQEYEEERVELQDKIHEVGSVPLWKT